PDFYQIRCSPADDYENSQQRDIGVAVCHGVNAYLNQSDHRDQRSEEPEPSHKEIAPLPKNHGKNRNDDECECGQRRRRNIDRTLWMRIYERQIDRPEGPFEIINIRKSRISQVYPE